MAKVCWCGHKQDWHDPENGACIVYGCKCDGMYRTLEHGEIILDGDEVNSSGGWNDLPAWTKTTCAGETAPDPLCPGHRVYRRKI